VPYLRLGPYLVTGTVEEQYGVFTITARSFLLQNPGTGGWAPDEETPLHTEAIREE
jgi:hypothetical protein